MSLIIPGRDMPKDCLSCPCVLVGYDEYGRPKCCCQAFDIELRCEEINKKDKRCKLFETKDWSKL